MYSGPIRIPGELLTPTADPVHPAHLITEPRQYMARLRPFPATHHSSAATFVHSDLEKCTHVFLRQITTRLALEPLYSGPHQVLSRREKTLRLFMRGRPVTVSAGMVKPVYILSGTDCGNSTFNPVQSAGRRNRDRSITCHATTALHMNYTLRSPHPFPHSETSATK